MASAPPAAGGKQVSAPSPVSDGKDDKKVAADAGEPGASGWDSDDNTSKVPKHAKKGQAITTIDVPEGPGQGEEPSGWDSEDEKNAQPSRQAGQAPKALARVPPQPSVLPLAPAPEVVAHLTRPHQKGAGSRLSEDEEGSDPGLVKKVVAHQKRSSGSVTPPAQGSRTPPRGVPPPPHNVPPHPPSRLPSGAKTPPRTVPAVPAMVPAAPTMVSDAPRVATDSRTQSTKEVAPAKAADSELHAFAKRLRETPFEDAQGLCAVLEAIESVTVTVELLRDTQLGVLTQRLKDHPDRGVSAVTKRLRKNWKDVVHLAQRPAEVQDEADEEKPVLRAVRLRQEAEHASPPPAQLELVVVGMGAPIESALEQGTPDIEVLAARPMRFEHEAKHGMLPPAQADSGASADVQSIAASAAAPPQPTGHASNPALRLGSAASIQARRKRAELTANIQWLCRLFLETREQLFALHDNTERETIVCNNLREELDVTRFRQLVEAGLCSPPGTKISRRLLRVLRGFLRRALHGRRRSAMGRSIFERFVAACAGHGDSRAFVQGAVPKVLQIVAKQIEEDKRRAKERGELDVLEPELGEANEAGSDPWADTSGTDGADSESAASPGRGASMARLAEQADEFLASASGAGPAAQHAQPAALCLPDGEVGQPQAEVCSGSRAPRGRGQTRRPDPEDSEDSEGPPALEPPPKDRRRAKDTRPRKVRANPPYLSGDPELLASVARTPLAGLDGLVDALLPGAELVSDGLLLQFSDDELVAFANVLEQLSETASARLVKDLEVREELRSTCLHRREYLQLLDGSLGLGLDD